MTSSRTITKNNSLATLKETISDLPVICVDIDDQGTGPRGLLILRHDFSIPAAIRELQKNHLTAGDLTTKDLCTGSTKRLEDLVAIEIGRVRSTRLPLSLLLLEKKSRGKARENAMKALLDPLAASLDKTDVLAVHKPGVLGVLLPGAGVGRATRLARELLINARESLAINLVAGITVFHAGDRFSPVDLIGKAEQELHRAAQNTDADGAVSCSHDARSEFNCQVTTEERAQLFQFFQNNGET